MGHSHQPVPERHHNVRQFNLPGVDKVKGHGARRAGSDGESLGQEPRRHPHDPRVRRDALERRQVEDRVGDAQHRNADGSYVAPDAGVAASVAACTRAPSST
jgi:hypothetical protein